MTEIEQLQAENATLKTHNRRMVEALGELLGLSNAPKPQCKIEYVPHNTVYCLGEDVPEFGLQTMDSEERMRLS